MAAEDSSGSPLISFLSDPATLVGLGLIAAGTAYYMASRPVPVKPPLPLDNQSLEMPVSLKFGSPSWLWEATGHHWLLK